MQMSFADPTPTDLKDTLEAMRAAVAGEGAHQGLAGAVQQAFLKLIEVLVAMLLDFRAGKLAPLVAAADDDDAGGAGATGAAATPRPISGEPAGAGLGSGSRGWWPAAWFRRHGWMPACAAVIPLRGASTAAVGALARDSDSMGPGLRRDDGCGRHLRRSDEENEVEQGVLVSPAARNIMTCATRSDGPARSGCGFRRRNDDTIRSGGDAAVPPLEGSSARRSGGAPHPGPLLREVREGREKHTPRPGWRAPPGGGFFKNAALRARIRATGLFQHENDLIAPGNRSIFSYIPLFV
jgi:hypothetical protein